MKALLRPANFTLGPDVTLNTEKHKKKSVRRKALNSVNASKRKHKYQIYHYIDEMKYHDTEIFIMYILMQTRVHHKSKWNKRKHIIL